MIETRWNLATETAALELMDELTEHRAEVHLQLFNDLEPGKVTFHVIARTEKAAAIPDHLWSTTCSARRLTEADQ